jgi:hypothetical protein
MWPASAPDLSLLVHPLKWPTLGVLSGSIAHDLYKPLAPILGHAEINTEEAVIVFLVAESAKQIQSDALKAADLTKRLLSYVSEQRRPPTVLLFR